MVTSNETQARRWFEEVWNQRRGEAVEEILEPGCVGHTAAGDMVGGQPFLENIYRPFLDAFPDLQITVEDILSVGDKVVVRGAPGVRIKARDWECRRRSGRWTHWA